MAKTYYNGVLLPEIPSEYASEYPYHIIAKRYQSDGTTHYAYVLTQSKARMFTSLNTVEVDDGSTVQTLTTSDGETLKVGSTLTNIVLPLDGENYYEIIWSNYDIECYPSSNKPYFKGGEHSYAITKNKLAMFGDEIRRISGKTEKMETNEMLDILQSAEGIKGEPKLQDKTITENGTYSADSGYDALGEVTVNCASGGEELNIHYGDTEPSDTSKLWVKCDKPNKVTLSPNIQTEGTLKRGLASLPYSSVGGVASVGTKIYTFGGIGYANAIYEFDTETNAFTKLDTTIPYSKEIRDIVAIAVGTKIYLFGGEYDGTNITYEKYIYEFDTITKTCTQKNATLPTGCYKQGICALGTKVYLFGGYYYNTTNGSMVINEVNIYDTETDTITTSSSTTYMVYSTACISYGTDIYLFGGTTSYSGTKTTAIYKYDTIGSTFSRVNSLPVAVTGLNAILIDNLVYLFDYTNKCVYLYKIETNELTTVSTNWTRSGKATLVGNGVYFLGGNYNSSSTVSIDVYLIKHKLESGEMIVLTSQTNNVFKIINNDYATLETGVISTYLGNSDNVGEKVDAYVYDIKTSHSDFYTYKCVGESGVTSLSASVECNVGDLVIASIITRDTLTLSNGWTLISTSGINSTDTYNQRLSFAYKYAESTTETITVTQASSQRSYITMVALQGATGFVDNGYSYADSKGKNITVEKPSGLVLFGCSAPLWSSTSPYEVWTTSNDSPVIQLGNTVQSRLGVILDQSEDTEVTISNNVETTLIVGSLTIQGMVGFYGDVVVSEGWKQI